VIVIKKKLKPLLFPFMNSHAGRVLHLSLVPPKGLYEEFIILIKDPFKMGCEHA